MWNAKVEQGWLWKFVVDGNSLSSIGKVGSEPVERCTRNSIEVLKSLIENVVIYGVERSRQIKKSYDSYIATVQSMQNVIHHIEQGSFSTVPKTDWEVGKRLLAMRYAESYETTIFSVNFDKKEEEILEMGR